MKHLIIITFLFLVACSSTDNDQSAGLSINGVWRSLCIELLINNAPSGEYIIDEQTFNDGVYSSHSVSYTDSNCSNPNGNTDDQMGTYLAKEAVITDTGLTANRATFEIFNPFSNQSVTVEYIVYISNNVLYFGLWTPGGPYTIIFNLPYAKVI